MKMTLPTHPPISAYRADPVDKPKGGIVVIQEIFGVNAHIRNVTDKFAQAGYVAIAPAIFDYVEPNVELDYDEAGVIKGRELAAQVGFDRAVLAVAAAAKTIQCEGKVGAVGFCWGGTVAFLCATRLAFPAVSYYGGRTVPFLSEKPKAPLLFHFGEQDHLISAEDIARHRAALPDATIYTYTAGHGFNCDARIDYNPECAQVAWQRTLDFLADKLA